MPTIRARLRIPLSIWLALVEAAISGCLGPRPQLPPESHAPSPAGWRQGARTQSASAIDRGWWHQFGDNTLDGLVEQGLRGNDDQRIAIARVAEARAALSLSRSALLPHINAEATGSRDAGISPFGTADQQSSGAFGASVAYDTDLFGRLRDESAAASARLLESQATRDTVQIAIVSTIAACYISLLGLDARLEIAQSTLTLRADSLHVAQRRYAIGYSTDLDLKQAEAEYLATQRLLPALKLSITTQENALSLLLGQTPQSIERGLKLDELLIPQLPSALP